MPFSSLLLAQIAANAPAQTIPTAATGSALIVFVRIGAGMAGGFALGWIVRHAFPRWHADSGIFRTSVFVFEKLLVFGVGAIAGFFELWKRSSFETQDRYLLTVYIVVGFCFALAIALALLSALAKDDDKIRIKNLKTEAEQALAQRDWSIEAVGAISAVIEAKKERLAQVLVNDGPIPLTALPEILGPKVQVFMLIKSLHQQFARHVAAPHRLRVGIYMRSLEQPQTLAPLYSWDGSNENCFSNAHPGYMSLDAPGGAQSLVVQCFRSESPMLVVEDCERAAQVNKFVFFSSSQRQHLKSMVAYRYNLHHSLRPDALILTMDTDLAGFFSPAREFQCRLLMEETGRRLELELISLDLIQKLPQSGLPEK